MTSIPTPQRKKVLIAGGGVAALEAALVLRDLARDSTEISLIAPRPDFVYRPMTVREPFAYASARRYPLAAITDDIGVQLIQDGFAWVDSPAQIVHTEAREQIAYDALLLATGARAAVRYPHALTIDDGRLDEQLHGVVQDVEGGYIHSLAFVIPPRMAWPLPLYELALMTASRAWDTYTDTLKVTVVTPEDAPLAIFGGGASSAIGDLLAERGVEVITSAHAEVPDGRHVQIHPGGRMLEVDRVIALPELYGPAVRGLPTGHQGFIPVDPHGKIRGVEHIWAAGDATEFAVKHGGIAAQQADAAAQSIAAFTGAPVTPKPFHPTIRGMLLTGGHPRYLTARITGGHGFSSEITDQPTWSPATKIVAEYLGPYLEALDHPPLDERLATVR